MSETWDWPGPAGIKCGARAEDRKTGELVTCCLRAGHRDIVHHWEEYVGGGTIRSASWIGDGPVTFIGSPE